MGEDVRAQRFVAEAAPFFAHLPGAWCLIKQDRYLTLVWANDEFYELMECSEDEVGYRYAHRISALWDTDGVEHLARLVREAHASGKDRFRHRLASSRDARVFETEAVSLPDESLLCCKVRDCSREAIDEASIEQFREQGTSVAGVAGIEVFSYDAAHRSARVLLEAALFGGLPCANGVCERFPQVLVDEGLVHPQDQGNLLQAFDHAVVQGARSSADLRLGGPDPETGRWRWYRLTLAPDAPDAAASGMIGGVLADITEHKELAMSYLNETQFYYALLSEKDAYAHADATDDVILKIGGMWNLYNEVIDKVSYTEIVQTFINRVVHPDDRAHYIDIMRRENFISSLESGIDHLGCEFRRIVEQNQMAWMELSVHLLRDPTTHHVLALLSIKNIDKKKRQELQMQSASERDSLTEVLHKKAAETAVRSRLRSTAPHDVSALVVLDIDDFKAINDRWGHKVGDQALVRFVHDVRCSAGKDDVLGRFGGDEFVLFIASAFDEEHVASLLSDIFERVAREADPALSCSAGAALMPDGMTYDEGFRRADAALYEAKAAGKATFRFYRAEADAASLVVDSLEERDRGAQAERESFPHADAPKWEGVQDAVRHPDESSFAEFLSTYGEIAYLVDPDTFTLICGNQAFYARIGESPISCMGKKCYEAMQGRATPCPFCSKANWSTDKFFMWRNDNKALDQEFLIKNKLVSWAGREVLLAIAVDVSNNKSIVDSLDSGISETHCLLGGIQQMNAARDSDEVMSRALETVGDFFRAESALFWARARADEPLTCLACWSRTPGARTLPAPDDGSLDLWLAAQRWDEPVMVESPEAVLRSSYPRYRSMKDNGVANERWIRLRSDREDAAAVCYLSVENLGANLQNVAFLESFSVFVASELDKRRMMEDLLHASSHDDLTGLLNRESYERMLAEFDADGACCVGVVSANVNNMRAINGSKGFAAGNYYLQQFAAMLLDVFPSECVYRLNGDEFAAVVPGLDREGLENRMRDLRAMVKSNGLFTVALGSSWDEVEKDLDVLTNQASEAMEADKKRHHDVKQDKDDDDRRTALRNLVASLGDGKFVVYLQPKVSMTDGRLVGAEALVRYRDDELGIISPARFIQGFEDSGLIRHVDLFVFEWVCQVVERWEGEGHAVPVSFNFSRRTLLENDLVTSMESIVSRHDLSRSNLEIEITESFAAIGKSVLFRAANDLLSAGFTLSLDDFGTKYTDLSILSSIDFSMIKLDKSLIESVVDDATKQTVLKHIIGMCDELRVDVIAEGVESTDQERVLRGLGCRKGQGYLYSRPIPLEDFEQRFLR
ncbi:bifunctional diguanylate cyclase/phosphodiesterase [Eggerthella timonensis]|uniref:bifunctional diguanylate cyclase/phosphodiesterase n=1 Tax=Eggerthella timonensis TaxID=1871008 RepID=UPI000C76FBA3|nr:bifunctional diguanylate cyclase/phosphodiesterase [Eggerthella timonensis]